MLSEDSLDFFDLRLVNRAILEYNPRLLGLEMCTWMDWSQRSTLHLFCGDSNCMTTIHDLASGQPQFHTLRYEPECLGLACTDSHVYSLLSDNKIYALGLDDFFSVQCVGTSSSAGPGAVPSATLENLDEKISSIYNLHHQSEDTESLENPVKGKMADFPLSLAARQLAKNWSLQGPN